MNLKVLSIVSICFFLLNIGYAQNSKQWRGLDRSGHYPSDNILKVWPEDGPELILHLDSLPDSYSSVVLHDSIMYTTGIIEEDEYLTAIDLKGNVKWSIVYGKAWDKTYASARATPTIENNQAYMISGSGHIACVDIQKGELIWSIDGFTKFGGLSGTWGVAESPLIVDDKLIYTPGGNSTTMVALNKNTGETIWKTESIEDVSSYCSPVLIEKDQYKLIVTVTGNYVICVNADNGEFMWKFAYKDVDMPFMGGDINPVTPLIKGNDIFVTSGYNHVGIMLQMADDYKSVSLKWKTDDLDVHHGGVLLHNGYIYGSNYTSIRKGNWVCLDWETGELQYEHSWFTKGSIVASDGMLICYEEKRGNIALVEAGHEKFNLISSFKIKHGNGPHWSHPSIYDNKLFIRHGKSLMVYDIQANELTNETTNSQN